MASYNRAIPFLFVDTRSQQYNSTLSDTWAESNQDGENTHTESRSRFYLLPIPIPTFFPSRTLGVTGKARLRNRTGKLVVRNKDEPNGERTRSTNLLFPCQPQRLFGRRKRQLIHRDSPLYSNLLIGQTSFTGSSERGPAYFSDFIRCWRWIKLRLYCASIW